MREIPNGISSILANLLEAVSSLTILSGEECMSIPAFTGFGDTVAALDDTGL